MEKEQFLILIDKYVNGQATENEILLVEAYYSKLKGISEVGEQEIENEKYLKETLFKQIIEQIGTGSIDTATGIKRGRRISLWWLSAAALILVIFSIGIMLYKANKTTQAVAVDYAALIEPGGNKAVLTLANGKKVILDNVSSGAIAEQNGIQIKKKENGTLEYVQLAVTSSNNPLQNVFNTIETPRGGSIKLY
ncbi:hypothetical protein G7074_14970 [Pedobacter sp. HDW13]|uniref:hypothetical protein n=1 Tax=Pedobacter sp. HDW13 TaxID=2714940 RepID=UPI001408FFC9|nr:hypothetical protein [Pedobacter sp. HDW13]QIL40449.1 hypothetical protein G7074_14970 [Pedobacter sp. HDW13]